MKSLNSRPRLHSRNRYQGHYDLTALVECQPALADWLITTPDGRQSVNFSSPEAVRLLNHALLNNWYQYRWHLAEGHLCPPIPGRADYLHYLADLLINDAPNLDHKKVSALDIGCGANCIYPLIGYAEYGWRFTGTDINSASISGAQQIIELNPGLQRAIRLRKQRHKNAIFRGVIQPSEKFHLTLCNPPFHDSAQSAKLGTQRKNQQLGLANPLQLNFAGQDNELWCSGGEAAFIQQMITESYEFSGQVLWFSCLVSKQSNLTFLRNQLKQSKVPVIKVIPMAQGNKVSRILAWSYLPQAERQRWLAKF